jgi:hypothetical protein
LSFQDLALRVNLDDRLQVEDTMGVWITGRLTHLSTDLLTIQVDDDQRQFTSSIVRNITVRGNSRRRGVLLGAGLGVAVGALAACSGPDRQECVDGPLLLGGVGAAVGFVLGARITPVTTVYPISIDGAPTHGSSPAPGPFDDLALRVNLGDPLRVEEWSGARTFGRLKALTGNEMTLETAAGDRHFSSAIVRKVALRDYPLGTGALVGAVALPVLLAVGPACRSNPDCMPIAAIPFGAGIGLAVGALIPRMTTVFRAQEEHASLSMVFSRDAIGLQASLRW